MNIKKILPVVLATASALPVLAEGESSGAGSFDVSAISTQVEACKTAIVGFIEGTVMPAVLAVSVAMLLVWLARKAINFFRGR